jgi:hypothetical protein
MVDHSEIIRLNIERFVRVLEGERDPAKRAVLEGLLKEARAELQYVEAAEAMSGAVPEPASALRDKAQRWRMRAAEYRAVAEQVANASAHATYRRLAECYDALAERAQGRADRQAGAASGTA